MGGPDCFGGGCFVDLVLHHLPPERQAGGIGFPAGEFPADFKPEQFVGKGNNPDTYTPGVKVTLNDADCTGTIIEFDGWYTDADYQNPITEIAPETTGPISLYAKPGFLGNYIYFNPLGGVYGRDNPMIIPWGMGGGLGKATRQGFEFKTWSASRQRLWTASGWRI